MFHVGTNVIPAYISSCLGTSGVMKYRGNFSTCRCQVNVRNINQPKHDATEMCKKGNNAWETQGRYMLNTNQLDMFLEMCYKWLKSHIFFKLLESMLYFENPGLIKARSRYNTFLSTNVFTLVTWPSEVNHYISAM